MVRGMAICERSPEAVHRPSSRRRSLVVDQHPEALLHEQGLPLAA
jgi:hypothetical protein